MSSTLTMLRRIAVLASLVAVSTPQASRADCPVVVNPYDCFCVPPQPVAMIGRFEMLNGVDSFRVEESYAQDGVPLFAAVGDVVQLNLSIGFSSGYRYLVHGRAGQWVLDRLNDDDTLSLLGSLGASESMHEQCVDGEDASAVAMFVVAVGGSTCFDAANEFLTLEMPPRCDEDGGGAGCAVGGLPGISLLLLVLLYRCRRLWAEGLRHARRSRGTESTTAMQP